MSKDNVHGGRNASEAYTNPNGIPTREEFLRDCAATWDAAQKDVPSAPGRGLIVAIVVRAKDGKNPDSEAALYGASHQDAVRGAVKLLKTVADSHPALEPMLQMAASIVWPIVKLEKAPDPSRN